MLGLHEKGKFALALQKDCDLARKRVILVFGLHKKGTFYLASGKECELKRKVVCLRCLRCMSSSSKRHPAN